ncbi:MAG: UDP-N-acetylmuramoylalanyl-D-glutamyl-2,6-diaminopimelate--D-alanyl-D-alanine ligase [Rhodospirillales bacterium]|nr:UDP-N-acetylmuramoylalanyl-D-glutamyl-2,6-diaminopimelate--D-alanyl-D-alanine ligase [Rhodospirillales bacterium]MSP79518.1 UDP-N-acetylmuramoylalanyl-D-glutamyl-2,6-diaminopimelate--D-alanyl-D-alanine ligase [Rhodospirillales bacterium]
MIAPRRPGRGASFNARGDSPARRPILWTAAEVALATGGDVGSVDWQASGVSIDTRTIQAGDLFVALKGPRLDGHAFVADAFKRGAAAAVVARHGRGATFDARGVKPARVPEGLGPDAALVRVADTQVALEGLGRAARARADARVVAVTGSVGKTGVKEALRHVLSRQGSTTASVGSFNNQWGVPLSLARMPSDAAFGVFEIGMNHAGEITPLVKMVRPNVAVVTAIAPVHIEFFPSLEAIADAKAEIFFGVETGGAAVLPAENPYYARLVASARAAGVERIVTFGAVDRPEVTVRARNFELHADGSNVEAEVAGRRIAYRLGLAGRHWVANSLAVLAAVYALGADVAAAAAGLADVPAMKGRGERHRVAIGAGAFLLIDESYNASPASMAAALAAAGAVAPGPGGRRIAVLGDMLELGGESAAHHAALSGPLREARFDLVFTTGPHMAMLAKSLPPAMRGGHAESAASLAPVVVAALRPGDVVLVKGSAGSRTGTIVQALLVPPANNGA